METETEFEKRLSLIETILANKFPDLTKEMVMQILDLKQMGISQSRFYQETIQEGFQQGRQKGHQEGQHEGEVSLVARQLTRRLVKLSDDQVEIIRQLSVPQLEDFGEALLDYTEMVDLEGFLAKLE